MKLNIFTIYDNKAKAFLPPFYARTKGEAIRSFQSTVNDPTSNMNKYPGDFALFQLGEFDDETAKITQNATPDSLGPAENYLEQAKNPARMSKA